jgi:hypothetical protein
MNSVDRDEEAERPEGRRPSECDQPQCAVKAFRATRGEPGLGQENRNPSHRRDRVDMDDQWGVKTRSAESEV